MSISHIFMPNPLHSSISHLHKPSQTDPPKPFPPITLPHKQILHIKPWLPQKSRVIGEEQDKPNHHHFFVRAWRWWDDTSRMKMVKDRNGGKLKRVAESEASVAEKRWVRRSYDSVAWLRPSVLRQRATPYGRDPTRQAARADGGVAAGGGATTPLD